jgi:hypothetical protein
VASQLRSSERPSVAHGAASAEAPQHPRHPSDREEDYATMTRRERYLFDLQGYVILRGMLSPEEVGRINVAFDANLDQRSVFGPANETSGDFRGRPLEGSHGSFRHWGGMLTWPEPHCKPFRELLCHPNLVPCLNTLLGRGWHLDHGADSINAVVGCEGLQLHGFGSADLNGGRFYMYQNGRMRCGLINCQIYTTDVNDGDGGLVLIPVRPSSLCPLYPLSRRSSLTLIMTSAGMAGGHIRARIRRTCSRRESCSTSRRTWIL